MNFSLTNKNKQRQIRKKVQDDNDELNSDSNNLNNNNNENTSPVVSAENEPQTIKSIVGGNSKRKSSNTFSTKQKSTSGGGKSLSLFSFENDEDQDNQETDGGMKFNPIIATKRNDSIFEDSKAATINNESYGQYTAEMINSLKKNSTSKPPSSKQQQDTIDNIDDDIDKMEIDHQQYIDQTTPDTTTTTASSIPSIEQIKLAKEKRQRARDGKFQDTTTTTTKQSSSDFLSLKVIGKDSSSNVNNKDEETSRIVREEDDDEMEEEYNILNSNTIKFGDPGKSTLSNKKDEIKKTIDGSKTSGNIDEEDDSEEDEELTRWRLDQIRKGGGSKDPQIQSIEYQRKKIEKDLLLMGPSESTFYKSSSNIISNPKLSSNSSVVVGGGFIESICKDLNSILVQLKEVKHNHQSEFNKVQEALRDAVINCSVLESDEHSSQDQYVYYDELKQYCNNMIDCLGEKIPQIEELEDKYIELLKDHAHDTRKQFKTRLHDIIQDIQENEKSTSIIIPSNSNSNNNHNNDDEDDAELDEFGRDRNHYEKHSRKKRLEQYKKQQQDDEEDDFKLYDESDEKFYSSEKSKIMESIKQVMTDVDLEYSDIGEIASKFKHWKSKDLKSYTKSQMPLIMPSIFAPFIRLQMIEWSPLSNIVFDSLPWYNDLFNYSDDNGENQDDHIIPKLVEKIVIPRTETFITYMWSPLSKSQTNNLKNTIDEILVYQQDNSGGNEDIKLLFSQIISTLKYSVGNGNLLIPFSNRDLSFSIKMFKHSITILNNIKIWSDYYQYIPLEQLLEISDEIIDFQILPYLCKIYLNNNSANNNGNGNSNINQLFELFDSFYQYLLNLPWSNKKYKNQIHLLLLEFLSIQTPGTSKPDWLLSNDNLEKLKNLYIPFFSQ